MKKQEFIEKYGEEAWEKRKECNKKWVDKHKEELAVYQKQYREKNREKLLCGAKERYYSHKDSYLERAKKWKECNKEKRKEIISNWISNNQLYVRANSLVQAYNVKDKKRGLDINNNIGAKWVMDNIFSGQSCIYCDDQDWTHLGCDRIDNTKPHTPDNVVCSCGLCNIERGDRYSVEEFKQYRSLHPRACDIPKAPAIQLSETGALKKRAVRIG